MKIASGLIGIAVITIGNVFLLGQNKSFVAAAQSVESRDTNGGTMEQQVVAKEREGLDALKAGDLQRFADLTADNAVFVDAQGPASKAQVMSNVGGFKLTEYAMEGVRFLRVSEKSGLIAYKITEKGVSHGKEFTAQVYVSSIWTERSGKWLCVFSQETAARIAH